MEAVKDKLVQRFAEQTDALGVLAVRSPHANSPLTNGFDLLILVICDDRARALPTIHYSEDAVRIQERRVDASRVSACVMNGGDRRIIQWMLQGEIWLDRNGYLEKVRTELSEFTKAFKERKMLGEFSRFLRKYAESKHYLDEEQYLDAYSSILNLLHHWARLAIIEQGIHPEVTLWSQVRKINAGVYKLYEELTQSEESLEQRVRLVLLACDFSVMSKTSSFCNMLLRIIGSKDRPWSVQELSTHPDLQGIHEDLSIVLRILVKKSLIREVAVPLDASLDALEIKYAQAY